MENLKIETQQKQSVAINESIADELLKLSDLREKGVLSSEEFLKIKEELINKRPHNRFLERILI